MSDISAFAEELVVGYLRTPEGQAAAKKCIVRVLDSAIESATGYNSAFRKRVDAAMARAIQVPEGIEIESYNDAILKIIALQVEHATKDAIERQVAERMKGLLAPIPEEIKLSELVEKYREYLKERLDGGCVCHGDGRMTFGEHSEGYKADEFRYFHLDSEPNKDRHRCDIRFGIYKGKMFSLTFQSGDVEKQLFVGQLYGFHRLLFQLKAAQTKIVVDCEPGDVDLEYATED